MRNNKKRFYKPGMFIALISSGISSLVSLVYFAMNIRLLFSGDYMFYSHPSAAIAMIISTIMMNGFIIAFAIISFLYYLKKGSIPQLFYYILAAGVFFIAIVYFSTNRLWFNNGFEGIIVGINKLVLIAIVVGNALAFYAEERNFIK